MSSFPQLITAADINLPLEKWIINNKSEFLSQKAVYGAVLLRDFQISSVEQFESFINLFTQETIEYNLRSSPRYAVGKNIYNTTTYPKEYTINMHSESSYAPDHPEHIVFCCVNPADKDGETPIADNRKVLEYLSDKTKNKFLERGVKYLRNLNKDLGLSWQEVFQTTDKAVVEADCIERGIDFLWKSEKQLVLTWTKKAIWEHPVTGEMAWFNHAFFFNKYSLDPDFLDLIESDDELPNNTFYGDGTEILAEEIDEIREAYRKATVEFPWQKGDVLFLDNMLVSHGRNSYVGDRKIIASLF